MNSRAATSPLSVRVRRRKQFPLPSAFGCSRLLSLLSFVGQSAAPAGAAGPVASKPPPTPSPALSPFHPSSLIVQQNVAMGKSWISQVGERKRVCFGLSQASALLHPDPSPKWSVPEHHKVTIMQLHQILPSIGKGQPDLQGLLAIDCLAKEAEELLAEMMGSQ